MGGHAPTTAVKLYVQVPSALQASPLGQLIGLFNLLKSQDIRTRSSSACEMAIVWLWLNQE